MPSRVIAGIVYDLKQSLFFCNSLTQLLQKLILFRVLFREQLHLCLEKLGTVLYDMNVQASKADISLKV